LGERICNHTFRATGITAYLEGAGNVKKAQTIAAHESPRTVNKTYLTPFIFSVRWGGLISEAI